MSYVSGTLSDKSRGGCILSYESRRILLRCVGIPSQESRRGYSIVWATWHIDMLRMHHTIWVTSHIVTLRMYHPVSLTSEVLYRRSHEGYRYVAYVSYRIHHVAVRYFVCVSHRMSHVAYCHVADAFKGKTSESRRISLRYVYIIFYQLRRGRVCVWVCGLCLYFFVCVLFHHIWVTLRVYHIVRVPWHMLNVSRHTQEWVTSRMSMRHVAHTQCYTQWYTQHTHTHTHTCHTHMSHTHVTHIRESRLKVECVMSHIRMQRETPSPSILRESCHTHARESRYSWEWVMSHTYVSHVTHKNRASLTHKWVTLDMSTRHVTHTNAAPFMLSESCHTRKWVTSHRMSHVTYIREPRRIWGWVILHAYLSHVTYVNESYHTFECVMVSCRTYRCSARQHRPLRWVIRVTHTYVSHVTYENESCHTHKWVTSHMWLRHVTHTNSVQDPIALDNTCVMSHTWVSHVTYRWVSHVVHARESCHICEWVMSHPYAKSCHICEWVLSQQDVM